MKNIQAVNINQPGPPIGIQNTIQATQLVVSITSDNLIDTCQIYFELQNGNSNCLYYGNMSITGVDYQNWGGDNDYPYIYVANRYLLTITS